MVLDRVFFFNMRAYAAGPSCRPCTAQWRRAMVASRTAALRRFFSSRPVFSCKKKCRSLEEEAQAALIQVALEKQAAQHGQLLSTR